MYSNTLEYLEKLKKAYNNGNLAIFIGAGLSFQLGLPNMYTLIEKLIKSSGKNDLKLFELLRDCEYDNVIKELLKYEDIDESVIQRLVANIISEKENSINLYHDNNYFDLRDMENALFITLNYDNLLKKILEEKYGTIYEIQIGRGSKDFQKIIKGKTIIYLHGSVNDPSTIILSDNSYKIYEENYFYEQLKSLIATKVFLFVGCSLNEARFKKVLEDIMKYFDCESYIMLKEKSKNEIEILKKEYDELNINYIPLKKNDLTEEIREILKYISGNDDDSLFEKLNINEEFIFEEDNFNAKSKTWEYFTNDRFKMIIEKNLAFSLFNKSSRIFRRLLESNNENITENLRHCSDIYVFFKRMIYESKNKIPFKILGENGVGKTKFMFFLYLYLMREYHININENYYPIYINLDMYTQYNFLKKFQNERNLLLVEEKIIDSILKNVESTLEKINDKKEVVLLIDGFDELLNIKTNIERAVEKCIVNKKSVVKKVIGISEKKLKKENYKNMFLQEEIYTIKPVGTCMDDKLLSDYIKLINIECGYSDEKITNIINCIKELKLLEINFFIVNLVINYHNEVLNPQNISLAKLYEWYWDKKHCEFENYDKESLEIKLENIAYSTFIKGGNKYSIEFKELVRNPEFYILNKQKNFFEYFIAKYLVRNLDVFIKDTTEEENIFSYTVYSFCRNLLLENHESETYNKIVSVYKAERNISNFAIYLLGRVVKDERKKAAIQLLTELLDKLLKENKQKYRFQIRSCYISLAYLGGEKRFSQEYILELMRNPEWDTLNNGFYLEYYGDLESDILYKNDLHNDKLKPFPKTFKMLKNSLESNLRNPDLDPLFDIKLYTLCSLVQKRLYDWEGKCGFDSNEYINVLKNIKNNKKNKMLFDKLYSYLNMIILHSSYKDFSPILIFKDILDFIHYKRRGWRDRNIKNPESILEHIANCIIKALILLPEETEQQKIEKLEIIKILAYHDIPEISTGDIRSGKENMQIKETQLQYSRYLSVLSTYPFINGLSDFDGRWVDFEKIEPNGYYQTAKSIDKIDSWFRAVHYESIGLNIDHMDFEKEIFNDIKDKNLQKTISKYFETPYEDLSKSIKHDIMIITKRNCKIENNDTITINRGKIGNIDCTKIKRFAFLSYEKKIEGYCLKNMYKVVKCIEDRKNEIVYSVEKIDMILLNNCKNEKVMSKYLDSGILERLYSTRDFEIGLINRF